MAKKPKKKNPPRPKPTVDGAIAAGTELSAGLIDPVETDRVAGDATSEFDIVFDPIEEDPPLSPEVRAAYEEVHPLCYSDPASAVARAEPLVARWPDVAVIGNLMSVAYLRAGMTAAFEAFVEDQFVRFPNYLFARINYASLAMLRGQAEAVPAIMGGDFNLRRMYPHRTEFHVNEVIGLYAVAANYLIETAELEQADACLALMEEIDPDHPSTEQVAERLELAVLRTMLARTSAGLLHDRPPKRRKPAGRPNGRKGKKKPGGPDVDSRSA